MQKFIELTDFKGKPLFIRLDKILVFSSYGTDKYPEVKGLVSVDMESSKGYPEQTKIQTTTYLVHEDPKTIEDIIGVVHERDSK